jgi:hypothetical protein
MEDGAFHKDNTGVVHFGFERMQLKGLLADAGFVGVRDVTAAKAEKENNSRKFPVFLIIAARE